MKKLIDKALDEYNLSFKPETTIEELGLAGNSQYEDFQRQFGAMIGLLISKKYFRPDMTMKELAEDVLGMKFDELHEKFYEVINDTLTSYFTQNEPKQQEEQMGLFGGGNVTIIPLDASIEVPDFETEDDNLKQCSKCNNYYDVGKEDCPFCKQSGGEGK